MKEEVKKEYQELITKFFAGEISDCEITRLKSWLSLDPENRRIFDEENQLWQDVNVHAKFEHYKTDATLNNIYSKLRIRKNDSGSVIILRDINYRMLIAAASVTCLLAIGGFSLWISGKSSLRQITAASTIVTTNDGEKSHIFLADSTKIFMNSGTMLQYDGNYNLKDRVVKLTGEAFFDVSTNPEKPFLVQTGQMSISATGTRFNVLSFDNEDRIETTLEEGEIQVSINGKKPFNLKSGQQIVYLKRSEKVEVRDVPARTYTSWIENKLRFNDTPFEEVLRRIGRKYNVRFEVTNPELMNLKYTATFIDESIEEVMQMLKVVSPITYKIYYLTSVNDQQYKKPRIVVGMRKTLVKSVPN